MKLILLFTFLSFTFATDELYTIYADGSYQYYTINTCYRKFFDTPDKASGKVIQTYIIRELKNEKNQTYYAEYYFADTECGDFVSSLNTTAGINCATCSYNITQIRKSNTFATLTFTPKEVKKCGDSKKPGERYVSNVYMTENMGKCVDGVLMGVLPMSVISNLKKENGRTYMIRTRYNGFGCKGNPMETVKAECGKCTEIACEINAFASSVCDETQANGVDSIFVVFVVVFMLLML